jgi:uncharacterized membrane protein YphA (DoxX/SURF4 family)
VIFIWAGLAKILPKAHFDDQQTAMLANMGVSVEAPASTATPPANVTPDAPRPPDRPIPAGEGASRNDGTGALVMAMQPTATGAVTPTAPVVTTTVRTASEFRNGSDLRPLYRLALMLKGASEPKASGQAGIIPASLGRGSTPVYLAWAAALTEVIAGALVLVGLFTRLNALALAGVMVVAAWLTTVGPNVGDPSALLGFLPIQNWYDNANPKMSTFNLQFSLFMAGMALAFMGGGGASVDGMLSGSSRPAPKPAPRPAS